MTTTIFDSISHADFLRLTLQAFSREGYAVKQSRAADADGVLLGKNGARIGIQCKKYRGSFIGRPVLQQFHGAMLRLRCTEACLITTTDCSPEAYEFTAGKGIVPHNRERTTELLRTAFGDAFMRSGTMPELGMTARPAPPAARQPISVASYERVPAADLKKAPVPSPPPEPERAREPAPVPEPVNVPEPDHAPREEAANEELPEEVQEVQSLEPPEISAAAPSENMTIIVCWECNQQLRVPIDQGMITVQCPECGVRRADQPEMNDAGELKTTTVITCTGCPQKLNVPTNRGQLHVRSPQCKAAWLFTP